MSNRVIFDGRSYRLSPGAEKDAVESLKKRINMTLPCERRNALNSVREFLRSLLDPKQTPKIPKAIRRKAYYRLKHYPSEHEVDRLAEASPDILGDNDES